MKISIIIPIYNEAATIKKMQNQLRLLSDGVEIIFVDGGSCDNTVQLISEPFKVISSQKGRANQMNSGALASSGEVLFFMHCDSVLPNTAIKEIKAVMKTYEVGYFGIKFDTNNLLMKCCELMSNIRAKNGIVFGDQGIFIKKELFFKLGMFPNLPIMEDYQLSLNIKHNNISFGNTKNKIVTSDRRFTGSNFHRLKIMYQMNKLRIEYRQGVDIENIAKRYKDIR